MGRTRTNRREKSSPEEKLSEDIGRKIVTAILDDDVKRHQKFKVLLRGHSRKAIVTYQEKETTLSLVQIACLGGNVQAAETLLGWGADKSICWDYSKRPGGWTINEDLLWMPMKAQYRFFGKSDNICDVNPPMHIQPLLCAKLSILHLAALANQDEMVKFLVETNHLPVDVRAGGTGVTPLMAVAAKRCSWVDGHCRPSHHTCGHPLTPPDHPEPGAQQCDSLLPMFDLLVSLGADPDAVDNCGCNFLGAAAAAGDFGLWDALTTEDRMAVTSVRSVHASRVLLRAAQYSCMTNGGRPDFFKKAADFLQRLFEARGVTEAFVRQLNEPATDYAEDKQERWGLEPAHALTAALQGPRLTDVAVQLLDLGVSLDALNCGQEGLAMGWHISVESALTAVQRAVESGVRLCAHGRLVMDLFYNCCNMLNEGDAMMRASKPFGHLVVLMHNEGVDFREPCWWHCYPFQKHEPNISPVSPLVCAIMFDNAPAVSALLSLLRSIGDTRFINNAKLQGDFPLVIAASQAGVEVCRMLIDAGAVVAYINNTGQCPLLASLTRRDFQDEGRKVCTALFAELFRLWQHHRAAVLDFLHQPRYGGLTLVQVAILKHVDDLVSRLRLTGMQLNLTHTDATPLRMACMRPQTVDRDKLIIDLVADSNPALIRALTERDERYHGLTVLGQAVAWNDEKLVNLLIRTCKREGLELAPLLERRAERSRFHAPLFTAIVLNYPTVLAALFAGGLELSPEISTEHLLLSSEALQPSGQPFGREFVREPQPGRTESLSLLMCAASVGNLAALRLLLHAGVDAREEPFPGNGWYRNALTAAIDFPDLPGFPGAEEASYGSSKQIGRNQLGCALHLLKSQFSPHDRRGALKERQMCKLLDATYGLNDLEVGSKVLLMMRRDLAQCRHCQLVGVWRKCAGCRSMFYCGVDCQAADWPMHRKLCSPDKR